MAILRAWGHFFVKMRSFELDRITSLGYCQDFLSHWNYFSNHLGSFAHLPSSCKNNKYKIFSGPSFIFLFGCTLVAQMHRALNLKTSGLMS